MKKQQWLKAAKQVIEAFEMVKLWRKAIGRANKMKKKSYTSLVFKALALWSKKLIAAVSLEKSLRGL